MIWNDQGKKKKKNKKKEGKLQALIFLSSVLLGSVTGLQWASSNLK